MDPPHFGATRYFSSYIKYTNEQLPAAAHSELPQKGPDTAQIPLV